MSSGQQRFKLGRQLGSGGTSVVYEAYDRIREMPVALKELRNVDPVRLYGFKREFRALGDLSHPNIVTLYELLRLEAPVRSRHGSLAAAHVAVGHGRLTHAVGHQCGSINCNVWPPGVVWLCSQRQV